ncbi:MAG: hypothetical protein U0441_07805 [Polyangiaceae bacterium]
MAKKQKTETFGDATPNKRGRKRVKVKTGQVVAVPLRDGSFALAHVALYMNGAITAHFAHRGHSPEQLLVGMEEAMQERLLAIFEVTSDEIYDGYWPVIGQKEPTYPAETLDMKGSSYTANTSRLFFDAYYGLAPWDMMAATPRFFEKLLRPGVPIPPTVRYKKDFERESAAATTTGDAGSSVATEDAITEGRGQIHIEIKYEGDGLPSIPLLKRREAIEQALESAGIGEITDAGGGGGVMDIYLETQDVARALPVVHAAIQEAGFTEATRVEVQPLDDEDDGEGSAAKDDAP